MGSNISIYLVNTILRTKTGVAWYGRRSHEIFWKRYDNKKHRQSRGEKRKIDRGTVILKNFKLNVHISVKFLSALH